MALRFVASGLAESIWDSSRLVLDGIGIGAPTVNLTDLTCDFEVNKCLWFDAGSRNWERVTGQAYDGSGMLEATGNGSFMLESARILAAGETDFPFAYKLSGSSSAALEVEHKTSTDDWSSLFVRTGDTGSSWQLASVRVPDGTVALRVVATLSSEGDTVQVDALLPKASPGCPRSSLKPKAVPKPCNTCSPTALE